MMMDESTVRLISATFAKRVHTDVLDVGGRLTSCPPAQLFKLDQLPDEATAASPIWSASPAEFVAKATDMMGPSAS